MQGFGRVLLTIWLGIGLGWLGSSVPVGGKTPAAWLRRAGLPKAGVELRRWLVRRPAALLAAWDTPAERGRTTANARSSLRPAEDPPRRRAPKHVRKHAPKHAPKHARRAAPRPASARAPRPTAAQAHRPAPRPAPAPKRPAPHQLAARPSPKPAAPAAAAPRSAPKPAPSPSPRSEDPGSDLQAEAEGLRRVAILQAATNAARPAAAPKTKVDDRLSPKERAALDRLIGAR